MLSLVNYGASDSENEITDDEEEQSNPQHHENGEDSEDILLKPMSTIKLPEKKQNQNILIEEEEDDEFLHKKEVPEVKPPPPPAPKVKEKVKIMIPKLSDFKDDDEDDKEFKKYPTAPNRKTGLLGMLPKPTHNVGPPAKISQVTIPSVPSKVTPTQPPKPTTSYVTTSESDQPKKIGFIPYALMDHKKVVDSKKLAKKKADDSDSDDNEEDGGKSFFTFSSKDEDLPQVSEDEIKSLIAKEANRIEQRKRQNEDSQEPQSDFHEQQYNQHYQQQQEPNIDEDAMKMLVGGSKAKRSKLDDIKILDLTDKEVLPNREEWLRKTLAGETSYIPTGKIDEKGDALAKRKHQLSYLSMRAEKNTAELEAMWAANRQNNREARSKYGF